MTEARPLPAPALETERLCLRPLQAADAEAIVRACSDPITRHWLPLLPDPYRLADAREYIHGSEALRLDGTGLRCGVALRDTGELVASVGLKKTDWRDLVTEVGYWAMPEHRGHGYVTEATRALSIWAFGQGLERVELVAAADNEASNRVARRAGFRLEGRKRNAGQGLGVRVDLNLYSLIRGDVAGARAPET